MFGGSISQVEILRVGVPDVVSKPFASQGEAGNFHLIVCYHAAGGVYDKMVSQPLLPTSVWDFSHSLVV